MSRTKVKTRSPASEMMAEALGDALSANWVVETELYSEYKMDAPEFNVWLLTTAHGRVAARIAAQYPCRSDGLRCFWKPSIVLCPR